MSDGPDSLVLRLMHQIDTKLDRAPDDLGELKIPVANVEAKLVGMNRRMVRLDVPIDRIERHADLTDTPTLRPNADSPLQ